MELRLLIPLSVLLLAAPLAAQQQPAPPVPIDRIIAFVGDSIIFESEVKDQMEQVIQIMQQRGETPPSDSAGLVKIRRPSPKRN